MIRLQDIQINPNPMYEVTKDMYYRGGSFVYDATENANMIEKKTFVEFFTYFNSCSIAKWHHYTKIGKINLVLEYKGSLNVRLFGHYYHNGILCKDILGNYLCESKTRTKVILPYPEETESSIVAFQMDVLDQSYIYDAYYAADFEEENFRDVHVSLCTTTFKKEQYVLRNRKKMINDLFSNELFAEHFSWIIVDNGRTLAKKDIEAENIRLVPNKNAGGAGGFTRGAIESLKDPKNTHIIFMDDDVSFSTDSFKRLYMLLATMKEEFYNDFISGAMIELEHPNMQHEDIGVFNDKGEHGSYKGMLDLNLFDSVLKNEEIVPYADNQYAGWWFCCMPTTVIRNDNLPLPVFVRGDDVEYSIRNNVHFITLGGICIWHEGFGGKFSGALELYQVHRNDLILQAMNSVTENIEVIERMKNLFWEEIYKFNYKGANLILDALEDFMKGPSYIEKLDGAKVMQDKKKLDNVLRPITPKVRGLIDYNNLYTWEPIRPLSKRFLYNKTCNGQKRFKGISDLKPGVIPYGWGYYQKKMAFKDKLYAIDPVNDQYTVYKKSIKEFKRTEARFHDVFDRYEKNKEQIIAEYRSQNAKWTSKDFWDEYLLSE